MKRDIKDRTMENTFPVFGWLNANDWLHSLGLHVVRHTKQITEIQADPGYPTKPAAAATEPDPRVTDEEFAALVKEIDDAQDMLLGRISGITDEQWSFRENPDGWSIQGPLRSVADGKVGPGARDSRVPQIGMLNSHDWLTLTALHVMRHTKRIIEVQEDPNYPSNRPLADAESRVAGSRWCSPARLTPL